MAATRTIQYIEPQRRPSEEGLSLFLVRVDQAVWVTVKLVGKVDTGAPTVKVTEPVETLESAGLVAEMVSVMLSPTVITDDRTTVAMRPVGSTVRVVLVVSDADQVGTTDPSEDPAGLSVAVNCRVAPGSGC